MVNSLSDREIMHLVDNLGKTLMGLTKGKPGAQVRDEFAGVLAELMQSVWLSGAEWGMKHLISEIDDR